MSSWMEVGQCLPVAKEHDDEPVCAGLAGPAGVEQRADKIPRGTGGVEGHHSPLGWRFVKSHRPAFLEMIRLGTILAVLLAAAMNIYWREESLRGLRAPQQRDPRDSGDCEEERGKHQKRSFGGRLATAADNCKGLVPALSPPLVGYNCCDPVQRLLDGSYHRGTWQNLLIILLPESICDASIRQSWIGTQACY